MKRILALAIVVVVLTLCMVGCGTSSTGGTNLDSDQIASLKDILDQDSLVYRTDTKVIYIMFKSYSSYKGYGYMSPYISENGKYCRYIDGKIVEITEVLK